MLTSARLRALTFGVLLATILLGCNLAWALAPEQIALIVNSNVPAGLELAQFYAQQRHIPADRIISLDLPDADDMPFADYDQKVVAGVRKFLTDHHLETQVTCLVTFYGVPLRIGRRIAAPGENEEIKNLNADILQVTARAKSGVERLEELARAVEPGFPSMPGDELPQLAMRADVACQAVLKGIEQENDAARRGNKFTQMLEPLESLYGSIELTQRLARPPYSQLAPQPPTPQQLADASAELKKIAAEAQSLHSQDPAARAKIRELARLHFGTFGYLNLLLQQRVHLLSDQTESAVDSELSLVWWNNYVRFRWQNNPFYYKNLYAHHSVAPSASPAPTPSGPSPSASSQRTIALPVPTPRTVMVTRLDGPTPQVVHDLIISSLQVEKQGLQGVVALDARGKPPVDAYGKYDQTLRDLANLLNTKTKLKVVLDSNEAVFPVGSVKNVALYCGWYSLRRYVPGMIFNRGAVGFHVASFEMVSLHQPRETGWVRGLMSDGVVGTLGPVAEPYLHSFPAADEFFPLLLTGKLTLAEVYWLSNPLSSWMQCCIGDPLYTPYKVNPAIEVNDLPFPLHVIFE